MKLLITKDTTDVTLLVFVQDSSSTTGDGLAGIVAADLSAYFARVEDDNDVTITEISLSDLSGTGTDHSDGGWEEISPNMPGWYRFDIPDAAVATGARSCGISLVDAASNDIAQVTVEIQLIDVDLEDPVRGGMNALPNAAADAAGGLPISDAGELDLDTILDVAISTRLAPTTAARTLDVTANGEAGLDFDNTSGTIDAAQLGADCITAAKIADDAFVAATFAASSLDGKGDWNTTVPDAAGVAPTAGEIRTEVDDALVALNLDHLCKTTTGVDSGGDLAAFITENTIFAHLMSSSSGGAATIGDYDNATDSLEALRDHIGNGTNLTEAGGTGNHLTAIASQAQADRNADLIESQRGSHTWQGDAYYVDPVNGNDSTGDGTRALPYATIQAAHDDLITSNNHDVIFLVSGAASGATTHTAAATTTISKDYVFIRGPGRNFIITRTGNGDTLAITGDGVEISGVRVATAATGSGHGIKITDADFAKIHHCWFLDTQGDGVHVLRGSNCRIHDNNFEGTGVAGSGDGIHIVGTGGSSNDNSIFNNQMNSTAGDAILIEQGTTNDTLIYDNDIHDAGGWGVNIGASSTRAVIYNNVLGNNSSGDISDSGSNSIIKNNNAWLYSTVEGRSLDITATGAAGIDWANVENPTTAVDLSATDIQLCDTITTYTDNTVQSGDSFARIGAAGVSLSDLGGMSNAMKAEILSEINDALDAAISELGVAAPTATPTLRTGLMLLYMALRNQLIVQTSGTDALEIYNNADTKIASKLLSDDGDDYTEAQMS